MYAYVAFLVVLLTYGMETGFFRFSNKYDQQQDSIFTTSLTALGITSSLFILWASIFQQPIAEWLQYPNNSEYVAWFAIIVGLDALGAIPLAKLRHQNKAFHFAGVNLLNVGVNIGLNVFFIGYCKPLYESGNTNAIINAVYNPEIGVGYVFISNLIASVVKFLALVPVMIKGHGVFKSTVLKEMLWFSLPLLVAGLAGIINETLDRILLKRLLFETLGEKETMSQLGIYGANYKISIIITLFIQAFRYAAEPFFFSQEKQANAKETYAKVMNYFVAVVALIFVGVMLFLDVIKFFIPNEAYWTGLQVVPILLMANIFLGMYYNQSIWYKITDKTRYGAGIAIAGALVTVILNIILIPHYGYVGSAWATLACYFFMVAVSFVLGQRFYPIPYQWGKIIGYLGLALLIWQGWNALSAKESLLIYLLKSATLIAMGLILIYIEKPFTSWQKKT